MDKIDNILTLMTNYQYQRNVPDPLHPITRRGYLTPEEAFDECEICGPIIPRFVKLTGRWLKGTCACYEQRYLAMQQRKRILEHQRMQLYDNYEWLGEQWSDIALAEKTFSAFEPGFQDEALEIVHEWLGEMHGSLILYSEDYGTGKTHLLAALVNSLRIDGKSSRFTTAPKLFRSIQEYISHNAPYTQVIHKACSTPLLVLDDVDKTKPNEFRYEVYFEIIDERVKRGLPTALSTNRVTDLKAYVGGAACSRLAIGQIAVEMNGIDYRTKL